MAVGADGVSFGKDDTATSYLISILTLNRVHSCNDNHLLMGANCAEDVPLTRSAKIFEGRNGGNGGKKMTTEQGHKDEFRFALILADMKW